MNGSSNPLHAGPAGWQALMRDCARKWQASELGLDRPSSQAERDEDAGEI